MLTTRFLFLFKSEQDKALLNAAKSINETQGLIDLKKAIADGANINTADYRIEGYANHIGYAYTALMWAAHVGHLEKIKFLVSKGANLTLKTAANNTALHIAAREGHLHIVNYFAEYDLSLLTIKGESGLTPQDMAERYNKNKQLIAVFKAVYSNDFFGNAKMPMPPELLAPIIGNIDDPLSLNMLGFVNKAWHKVYEDERFQSFYQTRLRLHLPKALQNVEWKDIFKHYFPSLPLPIIAIDDIHQHQVMKHFIRRMHLFYMLSDKVTVWEHKSTTDSLFDLGINIVLGGLLKETLRENYKVAFISEKEITDQLKNKLKTGSILSSMLTVYRELKCASEDDKIENERGLQHRPVAELKVNSKTALTLFGTHERKIITKWDEVTEINNWRISTAGNPAESARVHLIEPPLQFKNK